MSRTGTSEHDTEATVTGTTTLHPRGVNHLAISTSDMKAQLTFWTNVLGCPLRALYWMHGVDGCFHGFVELAGDSYIAFVQHPENPTEIEIGVTHAGNPGGQVTRGAMQHLALHVDTLDELYAMRDRIRSRGVHVLGPIDHGFLQSMYFAGPEGLTLEVCCGHDVDEKAWIDPEVVGLCGIDTEELRNMIEPAEHVAGSARVPQPPLDSTGPRMAYPPKAYERLMTLDDEFVWNNMSETEPPVVA